MGCIIGSTFSVNETSIETYNDIPLVINKIKENNSIAKYVRVYILQVNIINILVRQVKYNYVNITKFYLGSVAKISSSNYCSSS
jgi:hypothetical protein